MPKVKDLYDRFDNAVPVEAPWTASTGTVTETGGHVDLSCLPGFSTLQSDTGTWDLTDSSVNAEVSQVPIDGTGSTQAFLLLRVDGSNQLRIGKHGGNLIAERVTTGPTFTNVFSIAYSAVDHRWWRIRHDSSVGGGTGTIFYESSPDGLTWTTRGSHLASVLTSAITVYNVHLRCGHTAAETDPGLARFEGVNTIRPLVLPAVPTGEQVFAPTLEYEAVPLAVPAIPTAEQVFSPSLTAQGTATLTLPHIPGPEVIFRDDFLGEELDDTVWFAHDHGGGAVDPTKGVNNELQYYTPNNVRVEDSKLIITAKQESFGGASYTSALVTTAERFSFKYGRVAIRAKLPRAGGLNSVTSFWPSVFMLGEDAAPFFGGSAPGAPGGTQLTGGWPTTGFDENDLLEWGGGRHGVFDYHVARHWGTSPNNPQPGRSTDLLDQIANSIDLTATFNDYGFVWTPDYIAWEFNGIEFFRLTSAETEIPQTEMFLIANFAIGGGTFEAAPNGNTVFPAEYQIDSITVTQDAVHAPSVSGDGQITVAVPAIPTAEQVGEPASVEHFVPPSPAPPEEPAELRDGQLSWRGLTMGDGTSYRIASMEGLLDRPAVRTSDRERLRRHGLLPGDDFLEGRTITAAIWVFGSSVGVFQGNYQNLMATLADVGPEVPLSLRFPTVAGGGERLIRCRPRRAATPQIGPDWAQVLVQWDASDPRIYHPVRADRTVKADSESDGIVFPVAFPLTFGTVGQTGRMDVGNTGNFSTPVRFIITGPCTRPAITNTRTGQTLAFDLELGNGQILVVDSDQRTVLLDGNTNAYKSLTSDDAWFELPPGETGLHFTTEVGTDAELRATFRSAWIT